MCATASELTSTASRALTTVDETPYGISNEDARTRITADRRGKHRHQHERHTTPPGFWRTDMPTTQELEHDREEARRLERKKVEERWREAMREGGLWLFRDES